MSATYVATKNEVFLGPELAGTLMTPEEFDAVQNCDELYVYELIHGVLVVNPPPSEGERGPNEMLGHWLLSYQEHHPQGRSLDLTLPEHHIRTRESRRRADRVIWAGLGRTPNVRRDQPNIAIEFVSAGKRDRHRDYVAKRDEYLEAGLAEYWVIDRFERRMTVYRFRRGKTTTKTVTEEHTYTTPLLPEFKVPLASLLELMDRWGES